MIGCSFSLYQIFLQVLFYGFFDNGFYLLFSLCYYPSIFSHLVNNNDNITILIYFLQIRKHKFTNDQHKYLSLFQAKGALFTDDA